MNHFSLAAQQSHAESFNHLTVSCKQKEKRLSRGRTLMNFFLLLFTGLILSNTAAGQKTWNGSVNNNWATAGNWTPAGVPAATDVVTIGNSFTVIINTNANCAGINVGSSTVTIGDNNTNRNVTVNGNITVNSGGTFNTAGNGGNLLNIRGNLVNNGTFDMNIGSATARVIFNGTASQSISGTGITTDFFQLTVRNTGAVNNNIVTVEPSSFSAVSGFLNSGAGASGLIQGVLRMSGTYTFSNTFFPLTNPTINADEGIWLNNPNVTVIAQAGNTRLTGLLRVTSGTYNVGITNNILQWNNGAVFIQEGGVVNVAGRFAPSSGTSANSINFTMTGGTFTVSMGTATPANTSTSIASFDIPATGTQSSFTMSGGTIVIQKASARVDYRMSAPGSVAISGGTIQFGNSATTGSPNFRIGAASGATNILPDMVINAAGTPLVTLNTAVVFRGNVTLNSGTAFNANNRAVTVSGNATAPGNWVNNGAAFNSGTQPITFNNTAADQVISGTAATQTFNNLVVAKNTHKLSIGGSTTNVIAAVTLTLTSGNIDCGSGQLELGSSAASTGTLNYTAGNIACKFKRWVPAGSTAQSFRFPLGTASANRDISINFSTTNRTAGGSLTAAFAATSPGTTGLPAVVDGITITNISPSGYWTVTNTGITGGSYTATVDASTFKNTDGTTTINDLSNTRLVKRSGIAGSSWESSAVTGGTHTAPSGLNSIAASGLTSFSDFAVGLGCVSITAEPLATQTICLGDAPSVLSVSASSTTNTTYEWFSNTTNSNTGGTSTGVTTQSFTPPTGTAGTSYYYCVVTQPCGTATSAAATVIVTAINTVTLTSASGTDAQTVCNNTAVNNITYATTGATGVNFTGLPAGITGSWAANVATISGSSTGTGTNNYTVNLTGGCGAVNAAGAITILPGVVEGTLTIGDETFCNSVDPAEITFAVPAAGGSDNFDYQWYYQDGLVACPSGTDNAGWTLIPGATGSSYDPPSGLTVSRTYAVMVDPAGSPDCGVPVWASGCRKIEVTGFNTITATAGAHGTISPSGAVSVACGDDQLFTFTPDDCYYVADVLVDGVSMGQLQDYTFTSVNTNHTIEAVFALNYFIVSSGSTSGGTITPLGDSTVYCGNSITYTIIPEPCYFIAEVLVDGEPLRGQPTTITFDNVNTDHTIFVTFGYNPPPVCLIAGPDGPLCPSLTGNVYAAPDFMSVYAWSITGNGTISGSTNAQTVTVDAGSLNGQSYTLSLTITDIYGCQSTCTKTVMVEDVTPPVITCPTPAGSYNADPGECNSTQSFAATATDECGTATIVYTVGGSPIIFPYDFPVGTTTVTATATDASGNSSSCTFDVVVADNQLPVITCPANITVNNDAGQCGANVTFSASATDNCPGTIISYSPASGSLFNIGTTTVTATAADASGNSISCSFTVTVNDTENPVITCPADITVNNDANQCGAIVTFAATAIDNCPGTVIAYSHAPGSLFPIGTTTVTATATDASNNTSTCSFTVTVNDAENPTIICPAPVSVTTTNCYATVALGTPTIADNCPGTTVSNNAPVQFPVGTTTVTWTVTDASGHTATCTQLVTVVNISGSIFVNDNVITGDIYTTAPGSDITGNGTSCAPYATLAHAISMASPGSTIRLDAGTYPGNVIVNKSVIILGPNAGIDPNTGSRVAEAVVVPGTSDISAGEIFHITANTSNVIIDGLTIDGDNLNINTGFSSTNGSDIDAAEGITAYETGINNLTVINNIIGNLSYFGVTLYDYPAGVPSSGHVISNNLIQDMGTYDAGSGIEFWGGGVLLYNNQYASVSDNVMDNVRIGIQTGNFSQANPGSSASQTITGNSISARRRGVFHNLSYGSASPYTISNNTITAVSNVNETLWDGMLIASMQSTASSAVNNTISGAGITIPKTGIMVWNCQVAPAISGGTISGVNTGINVNNFEGYPSTGSNAGNTSARIDGLTITGATTAGIKVNDNLLNTNGATVAAEIINTTINGAAAATGIIVNGADASANIHDNPSTITGMAIGIDVANGAAATVHRNSILTNGIGIRAISGGKLTAVTENFITGNTTDGILIAADAGTNGDINTNNLSVNGGYAVNNLSAATINATCNWFGTTAPAAVAGEINGPVTYVPFLNNGTDEQPGTNGFQSSACKTIVSADPALVSVDITDLSNSPINANLIPLNSVNRVHLPVLNLSQSDAIPAGTTKIRIDLGDKMILDPAYNLATAPLSAYFNWTKVVESGHDVIYGDQIAELAPSFADESYFDVKAVIPGISKDTATFQVTNHNNSTQLLVDEVLNNNEAKLQYTVLNAFTILFDSKTDVTCFGGNNGSITVHGNGGATPYQFSKDGGTTWEPVAGTNAPYTFTGLVAGTYTIMAKDFVGQEVTLIPDVTITEPTIITLTTSTSNANVSCNGTATGAIDLTATAGGGTPGYTYAYTWTGSNGGVVPPSQINNEDLTGLVAGDYSVSVTVTDNAGCVQTFPAAATVTITEPAVLTATASGTNVTCFGGNNGTATVTAAGGTTPYTYLWSNGAVTQSVSGLIAGTYSVTVTDANGCTTTASYTVTEPPVITLSATTVITNVSCNGTATGAIDLTATAGGGTPGYTYAYTWTGSNGGIVPPSQINNEDLTGLVAGDYSVSVTVTDNAGCVQTFPAAATVTITEPAVLTATASGTNVTCFGGNNGTATVTAAGGTTPYTYLWSNGAVTHSVSGLIAGTYSVTVTDANGCTTTASYTVTEPPVITLSATTVITNVSCNGTATGAIDLTATAGGGTPGYTYAYTWTGSNGGIVPPSQINNEDLTGLVAGDYSVSVTVTDNAGCVRVFAAAVTVTVTEPSLLIAVATGTNVTCFGGNNGTATVTAAGGTTPYTYLWSNGAVTQSVSGLIAGTYSVTVTDANGCTTTASYTVTEPPVITLSATTVVTNVSCNGTATGAIDLTATAGGGTPGYTYAYTWTGSNGGIVPPSQINNEDLTGLVAGDYSVSVTVTDNAGCVQTFPAAATVTITEPAVLTATASGTNVTCFGGNNGTATVTAAGGTTPYTYLWSNGAVTQSVSGLIAGTYSVTVTDANGCTATASYTVTEPPVITLSATTVITNVSCNGTATGAIDLTATAGGGTPGYTYAYTWTGSNGGIVPPSQINNEDLTGLVAGDYSVSVTVTDNAGCVQTFPAAATVTITEPAVLTATASGTNVTCFGGNNGTATVTPTGGTTPYTYLWSNGVVTQSVSGLIAGTYSVTVTDANGCTTTASYTVTEPPVITLSATTVITNVSCNGTATGAIDLTATAGGGTPGYTYAYTWTGSNGGIVPPSQINNEDLTGLVAGDYSVSVTVTDNAGCVRVFAAAVTVTVTEPSLLIAVATGTNVSCFGGNNGTAAVTAGGGTAPYTYLWSNGETTASINGLTAGTYTVTVTDANGCSATASYTVSQPALLVATASGTGITCFGGSNGTATVNVTGGTASYSYAWTGPGGFTASTQSISGLAPGTYIVVVTDGNGCTATSSFIVTQPDPITAQNGPSFAVTNITCNGSNNGAIDLTFTAQGGTGTLNYSYVWTGPGAYSAATEDISSLAPGTYTVSITVTDANGCTAVFSGNATVTEPPVLNATVTAITHITCAGSSSGSVTVTATGGTPGYEYKLDAGAYQPTGTFTGLAAGSHTVTARDANGCLRSVTFTITEPANTDISLGSDFTGNLFVANGDEVTVVYNISELAGKAGTPATLRIFKPAGYNIIFDNSQTSLTIFPNTYTLDNGKWQLTASNSLFYEFSRTGPGGNNTIGCREKVNVSFKLKRVTSNISAFNLNAQFRAASGELILNNNSNSILMVGE